MDSTSQPGPHGTGQPGQHRVVVVVVDGSPESGAALRQGGVAGTEVFRQSAG